MHNVTILELPPTLPKGWDLADTPPPGFNYKDVLEGPPKPKRLAELCINTQALASLEIPPREFLVEPFIMKQSLNMLYAKRGLGKTWAASQLAISVASGTAFFAYENVKKGRVLYIDGEMTLFEIKERFTALEQGDSADIEIMPSEYLYQHQQTLNLHFDEDQQRLLSCLEELKSLGREFDLIILDNLSSLLSGKDENDNTEMDRFLRFLVDLRHRGYAVLLIHHAGKSGDQRGGSRREDLMDTVMKLDEPADAGKSPHQGAHFVLNFTKTRGCTPDPRQLDIQLREGPERKLTWAYQEKAEAIKVDEILKVIHDENPQTQSELAHLTDLSKGRISQIMKALRNSGYAKGVSITEKGKLRLAEVWPAKYGQYRQTTMKL